MKLTKGQIAILREIAARPNGTVVRPASIADMLEILIHEPRLVSDIYDMPNGGTHCRITPAGRAALSQEGE